MVKAKWIFLSLILAFIGVPIMTHVVVVMLGMIGGCLSLIAEIFGESQRVSSAIIQLIFLTGAGLMFASGRVWKDKGESASLSGWRQSLLLFPAVLALLSWIILLQRAELSFQRLSYDWITIPLLPWFGSSVISVLSGGYWGVIVIPVGSQLFFTLGYYRLHQHCAISRQAYICRSVMLSIIVLLGAYAITFRYYATQMYSSSNIKLLSINGITPTVDNIRNNSYPYTIDVYMVTRENPTPETQKLVQWFLSPQGQRLVQDVGYVPIYKIQE